MAKYSKNAHIHEHTLQIKKIVHKKDIVFVWKSPKEYHERYPRHRIEHEVNSIKRVLNNRNIEIIGRELITKGDDWIGIEGKYEPEGLVLVLQELGWRRKNIEISPSEIKIGNT